MVSHRPAVGGVAFESFYRRFIEPALEPGTAITHLVFGGLDGHRSAVALRDALAEDVLIAENLDGRPLGGDHGAPARLVSPRQYGFISTKHLSRIEVHTAEPTDVYRSPAMRVLAPHSRARVIKTISPTAVLIILAPGRCRTWCPR